MDQPTSEYDAETIQSLRRARIPSRFRAKNIGLTQQGQAGQALLTWIQSPALAADLDSGVARSVIGEGEAPDRVFALLARSLVLIGRSALFTNLEHLFRGGEDQRPFKEGWDTPAALFVSGFFVPHYPDAFTAAERYRMEWMFRDRVDRGLPTFVRCPVALRGASSWWSGDLLKLISQVSPEIPV